MNEKDDSTFDDELTARAAALPKGMAPERDLWPGIEQAISAPAVRERNVWNAVWAKAAAVVLLVAGSSGVTYMMMNDPAIVTSPVREAPALVFETVSGSFGPRYNLGPDYLDARRNLAGSLEQKLGALPEETRQAVTTNLATIRQAIEEINHALADEPGNVLLQELLLDSYRDELDLMIKVDGVTSAAMRRGDI
jgi:hypothetical protein